MIKCSELELRENTFTASFWILLIFVLTFRVCNYSESKQVFARTVLDKKELFFPVDGFQKRLESGFDYGVSWKFGEK